MADVIRDVVRILAVTFTLWHVTSDKAADALFEALVVKFLQVLII